MDTLKEKFESGVEKCQEKIAHYFGDECEYDGWEFKLDEDSFEDSENACKQFCRSSCYYTLDRVYNAVQRLTRQYDDRICDVVAKEVKKLKFVFVPGEDDSKKDIEIDDDTLKFMYTLECNRDDDKFFTTEDIMLAMISLAIGEEPKYRTMILSSAANHYTTYYSSYRVFKKILNSPLMIQANEKAKEAGEAKGKTVCVFDKINKSTAGKDKKDKRCVHIAHREGFASCQLSGSAFKEANYKNHEYKNIIAIDIYPLPSKLPGRKKMACTVWLNEDPPKKEGFSFKKFLPGGVPLPSVDMPSVDMPSVDLPSVDMPDIDMPDVSLPSMSMPSLNLNLNFLRREKEPKPRRDHPATMKNSNEAYHHLTFTTYDLNAKEDNGHIEFLAWTIFAGWMNKCGRSGSRMPFYMKEKPAFTTTTTIDDLTPDVDDED